MDKIKMIYTLLALIVVFLIFLVYMDKNTLKGSIYIIPEGYKGKLSIVYNQKNKPALEEKDGYQVVKFPLNGLVKTSSHPRIGKQHDKYFYYTKDEKILPAKGIKIGGGLSTETNGSFVFEFWIDNKMDNDEDNFNGR